MLALSDIKYFSTDRKGSMTIIDRMAIDITATDMQSLKDDGIDSDSDVNDIGVLITYHCKCTFPCGSTCSRCIKFR